MTQVNSRTQLQLRSLIRSTGALELSLLEVPIPQPGPDEVLVRIEASPLNPSDHGLLFGAADMGAAVATGTHDDPKIAAPVPAGAMKSMSARLDQSLLVGGEGAGVVVGTGASDAACALLGKNVAMWGGGMYTQFRCVPAGECLVLPGDVSIADGASAFVNPTTALCMIETMRREGHRAIVHTAAASNLGQMLQRLCAAEDIRLVNIVRSEEQEAMLRGIGATDVCNSRSPGFSEELANAIIATGATLAFDAIGGGSLAGEILRVMEVAASRSLKTYTRYGSTVHKQVYLYGSLDPRPTELLREYGMSWGIGGWLVMNVLEKLGPALAWKLKERIAGELKTTFLSKYSNEISLTDMLRPEVIAAYRRRETGRKYLVNPSK